MGVTIWSTDEGVGTSSDITSCAGTGVLQQSRIARKPIPAARRAGLFLSFGMFQECFSKNV
jgi:hypothetical protein